MANTLRFKRGLVSGIPTAALGEPLFTTDTFDLYIGNGTTNTRFQKYIASGTTSQLLRGDGSLLTMPIVLTSPSTGQVLKYNGTSWVNDSDSGITGSGSAGQVAYFTGATTQTGSNNFIWDSANNRLGIGNLAPTTLLQLSQSSAGNPIGLFVTNSGASTLNNSSDIWFGNWAGASVSNIYNARISALNTNAVTAATSLLFYTYSGSGSSAGVLERLRLDASGNLGLGAVPSAWSTTNSVKALQFASGSIWNFLNTSFLIGQNYYWDGTNKIYNITAAATEYEQIAGSHRWFTAPSGTAGTTAAFTRPMTLTANGRLLLGTTTEGTQRLQVSGDASITGSVVNAYNVATGGLAAYVSATGGVYTYFSGGVGVITSVADNSGTAAILDLFNGGTRAIRLQNGSVGIGATSLTGFALRIDKTITGAVTSYGAAIVSTVQSTVTNGRVFYSEVGTQAATFTLNELQHFFAVQGVFGAGSTVTNQYGFRVLSNMTGATNNYGFYGDMASGTGRWNLYMNGTAANFLNGSLGIGTTALTGYTMRVQKTMTGSVLSYGIQNSGIVQSDVVSASYYSTQAATQAAAFTMNVLYHYAATQSTFGAGSTVSEQIGFFADSSLVGATNDYGFYGAIASGTGRWNTYMQGTASNYFNGNVLIGSTTDSGEKLQVNGTMKVTGASTFNGNMTNAFASLAGGVTVIGGITGISNGFRIDVDTSNQYQYSFRSGTNATLFSIANSGAATFSSSVTAGGNVLLTNGTASSVGAINLIRTGTSPVASRLTFGTDGTGYSFAIGKNQGGTVTDFLTIADSGLATFTDNARFKNTKGILFENASASPVGSIKMGIGVTSPLEITNGTHTITLATLGTFVSSNLLVGASTIGTSSTNTIAVVNGTAPTSSATDIFHMYSADVVAGNAAPHFRTENGAVIKLYQETTSVGNSIISLGGGSAVLDDTTFDGYTLRQIVKALRNQGILQ